MTQHTPTTIGTSTGAVIPKEMLARLNAQNGDTLYAIETPEGYLLTPYDPVIDEQLKAGQLFVKEYRDTIKVRTSSEWIRPVAVPAARRVAASERSSKQRMEPRCETRMEIAGYYDFQGLLWRTACAEVRSCFDKRSPGSFS